MAASLIGLSCAAMAAPAADVAGLKAAALTVLRQQAVAESPATLIVDLGARDASLLMDETRVWLDDKPLDRYRYSQDEALALHQGGLQRLIALSPSPGAHKLRVDFAARFADAPPDHNRAAGIFKRDITLTAQPSLIVLELDKGSYIGHADLQYHAPHTDGAADADLYAPGAPADPRLREAAFLNSAQRPLQAAQLLFAYQAAGGPASDEYNLRLTQALQAFGAVQATGAAAPADSPAAGSDAALLAQAYADYNRGAELLRQGSAEGAAVLETVATSKAGGEEGAALRDRASVVLGYAQLRNHSGANAVDLFSRVRSPGPYSNAALLGLGWALLAPSGNGVPPQPYTEPDPQTPLPRTPTLLQPTLTADIAKARRNQVYKLQQASPDEEKAVRRALIPWVELIGRDPLDPSVQEGMVAIPYVLNHIGATTEALDYYQRALSLFEAEDAQLDIALRRVAAGQMLQALDQPAAPGQGWPWWIGAYPRQHWWLADDPHDALGAPETFYLQHLMDRADFRDAMQDYHDLRLLDQALAGGDEVLRPQLQAAIGAQAALLNDLAVSELHREQRSAAMYRGEVRFALARLNEPAPLAQLAANGATDKGGAK